MPRRTKACAICRQKRIKCDATMPHCQMCIKFNRQCPGPTDAPLMFIDTSSYPSGKKPRKRPSPPSSRRSSPPRSIVISNPESSTNPESTHEHGGMQLTYTTATKRGMLPPELAYVSLVQVSDRYALNEALFSGLARYFCAEGRHTPGGPKPPPSWLHVLPRLATQSPDPSPSSTATQISSRTNGKEALSLAIRATTAAFGGIETRNTGMLEYAASLYGQALRAQGRVVANNAGGGKKEVSMDMVGASVMLGMFEAVVATTGRAYAEHIIGAAKMLDVAMSQSQPPGASPLAGKGGDGKGPPKGPGPLLTHIFFHIRIQLAFVLVTSVESRMRHDPIMHRALIDACDWPYARLPLNMQIIRPLAHLITLTLPSSPKITSPSSWTSTYESACSEVAALWTKYQTENQGQPLCWFNEKAGRADFRDPFTAIQYAYFAACWILIGVLSPPHLSPSLSPQSVSSSPSPIQKHSHSLPHRTSSSPLQTYKHTLPHRPPSTSPPPPPLTNSTTPTTTSSRRSTPSESPGTTPDHFALIIGVASFLRIRDVGFSYLRLHLPLILVAMYAPSADQQRAARAMFEEWERGALRGIGVLGLERLAAGGDVGDGSG